MYPEIITTYKQDFAVGIVCGGAFLKIAIVDDSSKDRAILLESICRYAKAKAILVHVTEYASGEALLESAQLTSIDAVFLDIYMNGQSGMEVAQRLRNMGLSCRIIFVTTSPEFGVQSYRVGAFYYVLKPYDYDDIACVMDKLEFSAQKSSRYIKVKEGRDWLKILLADILYADYSNHYVQIHTESRIVRTYMKFSEFEKILADCGEFLSCYRCIIVNMDRIKKVDDLFFLLCNGEYIPINRKRVKEIKACYVEYVFDVLERSGGNAS